MRGANSDIYLVLHDRDGDALVTKNQRVWRLLAAMAGVALDIAPIVGHHFVGNRGGRH